MESHVISSELSGEAEADSKFLPQMHSSAGKRIIKTLGYPLKLNSPGGNSPGARNEDRDEGKGSAWQVGIETCLQAMRTGPGGLNQNRRGELRLMESWENAT